MALTTVEKATIRLLLGFPDQFRFRNTRLESILDNISPEAETLIRTQLTSLALVELQITTATAAAASGVKRVDEITFKDDINGLNSGLISAEAAGKLYASRISIILGVPINAGYFGKSGYPGDSFFGSNGGSGPGSPINLG